MMNNLISLGLIFILVILTSFPLKGELVQKNICVQSLSKRQKNVSMYG